MVAGRLGEGERNEIESGRRTHRNSRNDNIALARSVRTHTHRTRRDQFHALPAHFEYSARIFTQKTHGPRVKAEEIKSVEYSVSYMFVLCRMT
jgi:hypothetical protein